MCAYREQVFRRALSLSNFFNSPFDRGYTNFHCVQNSSHQNCTHEVGSDGIALRSPDFAANSIDIFFEEFTESGEIAVRQREKQSNPFALTNLPPFELDFPPTRFCLLVHLAGRFPELQFE